METIKVNKIVAAYATIKDFKVSSLNEDATIKVWDILSVLTPIVEKREKDVRNAVATLNDEESKKMQAIADDIKEKLSKQGYVLTEEDVANKVLLEEYKKAREKKADILNKKLDEEEVKIDIPKLDKRDIVTAIRSTDKTIECLTKLDIILK